MSILIGSVSAFYAVNIAWLSFECWRAPLVDENFIIVQEGKMLWEVCYRILKVSSRVRLQIRDEVLVYVGKRSSD